MFNRKVIEEIEKYCWEKSDNVPWKVKWVDIHSWTEKNIYSNRRMKKQKEMKRGKNIQGEENMFTFVLCFGGDRSCRNCKRSKGSQPLKIQTYMDICLA